MGTKDNNFQPNLRQLPAVHQLLDIAKKQGLIKNVGNVETKWTRDLLDLARVDILSGNKFKGTSDLLEQLGQLSDEESKQEIVRTINATGIILHTNLGRSPLPKSVFSEIENLSTAYCNMELDLETGKRGKRGSYIAHQIRTITGGEDSVIVNNGAAGVFLLLNCLSNKKETIVSRGELVQIGGGFRVPDIIESSGAILKEIGTTNITSIEDYEVAISESTSILLKIHRSNFYLAGHTNQPSLSELAFAAKKSGKISVMDLGSGSLMKWPHLKKEEDPSVKDVLDSGFDLVIYSGDKLLGGPQAGIISGKKDLIEKIKKHPLYRTMRAGRLTCVTLQSCLKLISDKKYTAFPAFNMASESIESISERANNLCDKLNRADIPCETITGESAIGGGSSPSVKIPTILINLPNPPDDFHSNLRKQKIPVISRIDKSSCKFDLRTVDKLDEIHLFNSILGSWHAQD
jgi:L-seryl-tRNA(Ser) seleniumtransferase